VFSVTWKEIFEVIYELRVFSVTWKEIFEVIYELRKETLIGSLSVTCYHRLNRRKICRLS